MYTSSTENIGIWASHQLPRQNDGQLATNKSAPVFVHLVTEGRDWKNARNYFTLFDLNTLGTVIIHKHR